MSETPTPDLTERAREILAPMLHTAAEWQYDQCDHGTYTGGPSHGQPYAMCEIVARRIGPGVAAWAAEQFAALAAPPAPQAPAVTRALRNEDDLRAVLAADAVAREGFRVWTLTEDEDGEWWAWSWREEGEDGKPVHADVLRYPLTVLHAPVADAPAAPEEGRA